MDIDTRLNNYYSKLNSLMNLGEIFRHYSISLFGEKKGRMVDSTLSFDFLFVVCPELKDLIDLEANGKRYLEEGREVLQYFEKDLENNEIPLYLDSHFENCPKPVDRDFFLKNKNDFYLTGGRYKGENILFSRKKMMEIIEKIPKKEEIQGENI